MIPAKVYIGDILVPTQSAEDLRELASLFFKMARLLEKSVARPKEPSQLAFDFSYDESDFSTSNERPMSYWLDSAWAAMGRFDGATGEEFYNAMVKMGYRSTADSPIDAVKASLRIGGNFVRVGTTDRGAVLWGRKSTDGVLVKDREPPVTLYTPSTKFLIDDPRFTKHDRVVDYVVSALNELGGSATNEELADKMVEHGWRSKSSDRAGVVGATLRKYSEFEKAGANWKYSPFYYELRANKKK